MNFSKEKKAAIQAASQASKILLRYYGKKSGIRQKSNKSLVGTADLEADKAILKVIKKNFPSHSIVSEESGIEEKKSDYRWIIDPLDGTHNFLHEIPFFGVSIAVEYKNEVVIGVLEFPVLRMKAVGEKGKGAFLNGKKMKASGKKNLENAFVLIEFSYANRKEKTEFLEKLVHRIIDVRNFGSAAYHLLLMACGKCDGFVVHFTHEWDVAAGFLLVEEAGGKVSSLDGKKWSLRQSKFLLSNGKIHEDLLRILK